MRSLSWSLQNQPYERIKSFPQSPLILINDLHDLFICVKIQDTTWVFLKRDSLSRGHFCKVRDTPHQELAVMVLYEKFKKIILIGSIRIIQLHCWLRSKLGGNKSFRRRLFSIHFYCKIFLSCSFLFWSRTWRCFFGLQFEKTQAEEFLKSIEKIIEHWIFT